MLQLVRVLPSINLHYSSVLDL